jgi:heme-degrading monooxygenase HmoA
MIARMWRGVVHSEKLDDYVDVVEETGMDEYRRTPGNLGAQILTRDLGEGRSEIVTISWWPDEDHVRAFAGEEIEAAKYYPEDDPYLIERDSKVVHYLVASD